MYLVNTAKFAKNAQIFLPASDQLQTNIPTNTRQNMQATKATNEFNHYIQPFVAEISRPANSQAADIINQRQSKHDLIKNPSGQHCNNPSDNLTFSSHLQEESGSTNDVLKVLNDTSLPPNLNKQQRVSRVSQLSSIRNYTTSTDKKTPKNQSRGKNTTTSSVGGISDGELSCCVVAITEGRGHASGEVGIAAMDPRRPHLILCQISDTQRYTRTLTKLNIFNFVEAIVPNTFVDAPTPRKLYMDILDRFPSTTVNHVQRRHFSEATGLQMIQQYCSRESESVMVVLKDKFYAIAAAAALLKYVEFTQSVLFAPYSLKVEFQGTDGTTIIDLDTANRLELVMGLVSRDEQLSLLGVLKHCRTRGGVRLLRSNLLQPFSDQIKINSRLDCVTELIENPILFNAIEVVISQMKNAESLLSLCMHSPQQTGLKAAQYQLKYALLLKTTLELVPALSSALENTISDYFQAAREILTDVRFGTVLKRIHTTIVEGTPGFRPGTFNQLHACFMICAGINGLLDIAKKTYCELAQEISDLVDALKEKLQLPMRLGYSQGKGYHIVLSPLDQVPVNNLPGELILTQKSKNSIMCYTTELVALDQRCQQALQEIELMTNVLMFELLNDIRDKISCLFPLCEILAELDVCVAFAHIGATDDYVRPTFGEELNLKAARHPILDVTSKERIVANDLFADADNNFVILTGPNQSGKSIFIRQVALLQVMAQVGSYVPATAAQFRIADRIFSRIGFDDSIEGNASTLMVELQEMTFIRNNLTKNSLIIVDELCRGTSVDEGTCLAFVLCEQLIDTSAFILFTTHYLFLTKLQDMYYNVRNFHFETTQSGDGKPNLRYTHKMLKGITPAEKYGIRLAEIMGFSSSILDVAKQCAHRLLLDRKVPIQEIGFGYLARNGLEMARCCWHASYTINPQAEVRGLTARYEISEKLRLNLPQSDEATWDQMLPVIRHYRQQYDLLPPEGPEFLILLQESSPETVVDPNINPTSDDQSRYSQVSESSLTPMSPRHSSNLTSSSEKQTYQNGNILTSNEACVAAKSDTLRQEISKSPIEFEVGSMVEEINAFISSQHDLSPSLDYSKQAEVAADDIPSEEPTNIVGGHVGSNELMLSPDNELELNSILEHENSEQTEEAAFLLLSLHANVAVTPSKRKWTPPFKQDSDKKIKKTPITRGKQSIDEFVRNLGSDLPPVADKAPYYQWKYTQDKKALKTVATACRASPCGNPPPATTSGQNELFDSDLKDPSELDLANTKPI